MIKYIKTDIKWRNILFNNKRIEEICCIIDKTDILIDVGTDHAYLPIYCLNKGRIKHAVITDVNEGPMKTAIKNITKHGYDGQIRTFITDGLNDIDIKEGSTIVISGMGGESIVSILDAAISRLRYKNTLILQPVSTPELLKRFLIENGFKFIREKHFLHKNHDYVVYKVKYTKQRRVVDGYEKELYIPNEYLEEETEALKKYLGKIVKRQRNVLAGYVHQGHERTDKQKKLVKELEEYYESI